MNLNEKFNVLVDRKEIKNVVALQVSVDRVNPDNAENNKVTIWYRASHEENSPVRALTVELGSVRFEAAN